MADQKNYVVLSPVEHDQKTYVPGKKIKLDDDAATALLRVGAIADPDAPAPTEDAAAGEAGEGTGGTETPPAA